MADVNVTVYSTGRDLSAAPNWTDNPTAATSGNNYYIPNNGQVLLILEAGTTSNVTIDTPGSVDGLAIADRVFALADTDVRIVGPFPPQVYNNASGQLKVTVSANTDIMAIRL